jgi:putative NIF3 family GTP cyclohydrolase 1 type 2
MGTESRVSDIVEKLRKSAGSGWADQPWDGLQSGSLDATVQGVAVAWSCELALLKEAVKKGCNLIITKDPVYWFEKPVPAGSTDKAVKRVTEGSAGGTKWEAIEKTDLYKAKKAFIESNQLNIYRIAQNWDGQQSMATEGLLRSLGWKADRYAALDPDDPALKTAVVKAPRQSLIQLAKAAKEKVGAKAVRVVGDPQAQVSQVAVHPGYLTIGAATRIGQVQELDVILTGESCEWEGFVYAEDWISAGHGKGFVMLGLAAISDTATLQVSDWVKRSVPSTRVEVLRAGDPFTPVYAGAIRS